MQLQHHSTAKTTPTAAQKLHTTAVTKKKLHRKNISRDSEEENNGEKKHASKTDEKKTQLGMNKYIFSFNFCVELLEAN